MFLFYKLNTFHQSHLKKKEEEKKEITKKNQFLLYGDESDYSHCSDKLIGAVLKQHVHHSPERHGTEKHPVSFAALNLILVMKEECVGKDANPHTHEIHT